MPVYDPADLLAFAQAALDAAKEKVQATGKAHQAAQQRAQAADAEAVTIEASLASADPLDEAQLTELTLKLQTNASKRRALSTMVNARLEDHQAARKEEAAAFASLGSSTTSSRTPQRRSWPPSCPPSRPPDASSGSRSTSWNGVSRAWSCS